MTLKLTHSQLSRQFSTLTDPLHIAHPRRATPGAVSAPAFPQPVLLDGAVDGARGNQESVGRGAALDAAGRRAAARAQGRHPLPRTRLFRRRAVRARGGVRRGSRALLVMRA